MADALTIDFALTNFSKVEKAFSALEKLSIANADALKSIAGAANTAAEAVRRLNSQLSKAQRISSGLGNKPAVNISQPGSGVRVQGASGVRVQGASGGSLAAVTKALPSERFVAGPFQRQQELARQASRAAAAGNTHASADIALAQHRNDKAVARASGSGHAPSLGSKFLNVLRPPGSVSGRAAKRN
jgi:hypothetical protein